VDDIEPTDELQESEVENLWGKVRTIRITELDAKMLANAAERQAEAAKPYPDTARQAELKAQSLALGAARERLSHG